MSVVLEEQPVKPVQPAEPVVAPVVEEAPAVPVVEPVVPVEPAAPVVEEPVVEAPVYAKPEATGNKFFDSAANVLHDAGFDTTAISQEVGTNGSLTDETRAALVAKLGESQVSMLESGLEQERTSAHAANKPARDLVYNEAGGEAMWKAIEEWTTTEGCGLTPDGEKEYNQMLAAGGMQAQLAVKALKEAYMASPGFVQPAKLEGADGVVPAGQVDAISRAIYIKEKADAIKANDAVTVAALEARARYTMANLPTQWNSKLAPRIG